MSVLFRGLQRRGMGAFDDGSGYPSPTATVRRRGSTSRKVVFAHSAAWACTRLRADLISTLPIDIFTPSGGSQVEVAKPPLFVNPGGEDVDMQEFMYSTQVDLD